MRDDERVYRGRLARFVEESVVPAIYPLRVPLRVEAWQVPDEPVPFAEALAAPYEPFEIGSPWGRAWSTWWFHVTGQVPADWLEAGHEVEIVMDLGFRKEMEGAQAEGLAYRPDGTIIKAIEPFNRYLPVEDPSGRIDLYLEAAANPEVAHDGLWYPTPYSSKDTVPDQPIYELRYLDAAVLDRTAWELNQDIEVLAGLAEELPADLPRRAEIVAGLNRAMDAVDPDDVTGTAAAAREVLAPLLAKPAYTSAHRVVATGHAHIDSAWLWPVRETIRKCARTFSNVLTLIEEHDELVFSCSSAQQYAWMKEFYPQVFERLRKAVSAGKFVPVGGMWVESDTNMPGSEALARQFVLGRRFFAEEFGVEIPDVWLPDSFGYSAALPQLGRLAGARWFLTQKMSWNETNKLPHHTFWWEGIDGSRIFTHFPPVDTYNSNLSGMELAKTQRQYAEQGHGTVSLVPFGYGDGGGGPTREMVAKARRTADLEGSPAVRIGTPTEFFTEAQAELANPGVWTGEMYLETHRGTYTSQLRTKQGNRRSEHLLHEAELWATTAMVRCGTPYPAARLEAAWRTVLLQQFHDILPGSSIAWVHREAEANYAVVAAECEAIVAESLAALTGPGDAELVANASPYAYDRAGAMAVEPVTASHAEPVRIDADGEGGYVLDNGLVRVCIDADGLLTSVLDVEADRELVPEGEVAGLLQVHVDRPTLYEAWDIDPQYSRTAEDLVAADTVEPVGIEGAGVAAVRVARTYRSSTIVQTIALRPGASAVDLRFDVDWHEQRRLLKLALPLDLATDRAASEIQFGHVHRPTHANTSWEQAQYETVAHRWVHVAEPGYGVAVVNDSTYGHDISRRHLDAADTAGTTVRLSLLRGPMFPDPVADQGEHTMNVSLLVGAGLADARREGWRINAPVRRIVGGSPVAPLVTAEGDGVVVQTVKAAEDGSGDVVVRLYEADGARARARVHADFAAASVQVTDLLERPVEGPALDTTQGVALTLRPFQIVTLRFRRS